MIRAGYIKLTGNPAIDYAGNEHRYLEISAGGETFALPAADARRIIYSGTSGYIWYIRASWGIHLDGISGTAGLSKSKRAVNFTMNSGKRFTVAVTSLRDALVGRSSYAALFEIETQAVIKNTERTAQVPVTLWAAE